MRIHEIDEHFDLIMEGPALAKLRRIARRQGVPIALVMLFNLYSLGLIQLNYGGMTSLEDRVSGIKADMTANAKQLNLDFSKYLGKSPAELEQIIGKPVFYDSIPYHSGNLSGVVSFEFTSKEEATARLRSVVMRSEGDHDAFVEAVFGKFGEPDQHSDEDYTYQWQRGSYAIKLFVRKTQAKLGGAQLAISTMNSAVATPGTND